jgi:hypothetical protein
MFGRQSSTVFYISRLLPGVVAIDHHHGGSLTIRSVIEVAPFETVLLHCCRVDDCRSTSSDGRTGRHDENANVTTESMLVLQQR